MKWKEFKQLSDAKKEEYNFKFKDKVGFNGGKYILGIIAVFSLAISLVICVLTIYLLPELAHLKPLVKEVLVSTNYLLKGSLLIIFCCFGLETFSNGYYVFTEARWKKKHLPKKKRCSPWPRSKQ